jgi:hypothetical protein
MIAQWADLALPLRALFAAGEFPIIALKIGIERRS